MNDWLLEYDSDGDIYTLPATNRDGIERVIDMFDGQHTFYCCLSNADESCLWCVGEPKRRLIEGRIIEGKSVRHFVLHSRRVFDASIGQIRHGINPEDVVKVTTSEVLTPSEVLSVFMAFYDKQEIPSDYELVTGVRLFGPNSFNT